MLVLVLLGVVWIVALAPVVLRKLRERERFSAVTSFTAQLWKPAPGGGQSEPAGSVPGAAIGFSVVTKRLEGLDGSRRGCWGEDEQTAGSPTPTSPVLTRPVVSRTTALRRRRVIAGLGIATIAFFALGLAAQPFLYLGVAVAVATVSYLGLLAYFHHLAVERAHKVVVLETRREVALALDEARNHSHLRPASLSRTQLGGTGWSVPDYELANADLAAAGR